MSKALAQHTRGHRFHHTLQTLMAVTLHIIPAETEESEDYSQLQASPTYMKLYLKFLKINLSKNRQVIIFIIV